MTGRTMPLLRGEDMEAMTVADVIEWNGRLSPADGPPCEECGRPVASVDYNDGRGIWSPFTHAKIDGDTGEEFATCPVIVLPAVDGAAALRCELDTTRYGRTVRFVGANDGAMVAEYLWVTLADVIARRSGIAMRMGAPRFDVSSRRLAVVGEWVNADGRAS